ncbi:MAG: YybS family protein [Limnochordia bacterium]|jgi:uncharacterized protein YybS (DUF2232 family)|nr:YybS family protein [Limnochordia bacterium]
MKTRSLTEGAMLGAITVLLAILGEYIGVPSIIVPIPLMLLVYRQGFQYGVLAAIAAALISSLVAGHVFSGLSIVIWGFVGVALGMALRERFSFTKLMLVGIASNLVVIGLNFFLYSLIIGGNVLGDMLAMFLEAIDQAIQVSESMGVQGEALQQYEALKTLMPILLRLGLPSLLLVYAVSMSYVNLAIGRAVLRRLGDSSMPWVEPFSRWRLPGYFGLIFVFGLLTSNLWQTPALPQWLQFLSLNSFLISFYAYAVAGISLAWYYFQKKNVPMVFRVILVFMLFTMQFLLMALIFLAMIDGVFDFRKLRVSTEGEK